MNLGNWGICRILFCENVNMACRWILGFGYTHQYREVWRCSKLPFRTACMPALAPIPPYCSPMLGLFYRILHRRHFSSSLVLEFPAPALSQSLLICLFRHLPFPIKGFHYLAFKGFCFLGSRHISGLTPIGRDHVATVAL